MVRSIPETDCSLQQELWNRAHCAMAMCVMWVGVILSSFKEGREKGFCCLRSLLPFKGRLRVGFTRRVYWGRGILRGWVYGNVELVWCLAVYFLINDCNLGFLFSVCVGLLCASGNGHFSLPVT